MLRTMSEWAVLVDQPGPSASQQLRVALAELEENDFPIFPEFSSHIGDLRGAGLAYRQRLISAKLALKVYSYRAAHGRLPESLDELPNPPSEEIIGLLSGKPLVYERTVDGFAIYDETPKQGRFEVKFARDAGRP